jgi:uncharacterized radical SAM superfamily protein
MTVKDDMNLTPEDRSLFREAWEVTRARHPEDFTFYLPGMVRYGHERGRYPAVSITGDECRLLCEHCKGKLLDPMIKVSDPEALVKKGHRLKRAGACGILLSGGSDPQGRLPWDRFFDAIGKIRDETRLFLSAHVGFPDRETCRRLKAAGVKQALIDVMGDAETATRIYHLDGVQRVVDAVESISESGLQFVPHIVAGLYYGNMRAEYRALEIISQYRPSAVVIVVLTPLKGTAMAGLSPPSPLEVGRLVARARLLMPGTPISLGCERPRNRQGLFMERLAIRAGANRMAVWSAEAVEEAESLGLKPRFQLTCCSVDFRKEFGFPRP